jgi:hypothetical protein
MLGQSIGVDSGCAFVDFSHFERLPTDLVLLATVMMIVVIVRQDNPSFYPPSVSVFSGEGETG